MTDVGSLAGADIKEMSSRDSYVEVSTGRMLAHWDEITRIRKPIIAAVNGFALVSCMFSRRIVFVFNSGV